MGSDDVLCVFLGLLLVAMGLAIKSGFGLVLLVVFGVALIGLGIASPRRRRM